MMKIDSSRIADKSLSGIYRLWFDNETLFYIGSAQSFTKKKGKWRENFRTGRMNKRMKYFIKDKTKAIMEVIEVVSDQSKLYDRENFYLAKYMVYPNCLNRSNNWYGHSVQYSDAEKAHISKKMSNSMTPERRKRSAEQFKNMSNDIRRKGHKTLAKRGWMKPVNQFDLNGNLIASYPSIKGAARGSGVEHTLISRACFGHIKKSSGFIWKFANPEDVFRKLNKSRPRKQSSLVE